MLKIPKNVMQIGTGSPNVKLYMEDYVHTFLERCQGKETCLAFGQQEEKDGIRYYLIYGVEKETDFRRGNFPYFQKLERIGKIEKKEASVRFWTVRGEEIQIGGYFIFYEQNEEMQAYMIAEREQSRPADVEEERVMEAINARREKRKAEAAADAARGTTASGASTPNTARSATASRASASNTASGRKTVLSRLGALKAAAPTLNAASRKTAFGTAYQARLGSTGALFPKLCRIGCLVLLVVLVGTALTSVNQYPDMKAVSALLAGAVRNTKNETKNTSSGLIVEETVGWNSSDEMARSAALDEAAQADDTTGTDNAAMDGEATDNRTTDSVMPERVMPERVMTDSVMPDSVMSDSVTTDSVTTDSVMADGQNAVTTDADAETSTARQSASASDSSPQVQEALARPESYQVQKGDSLIAISRRFYGTDEKVIEICRLNNIKDPNQIQPGQNILLPSK
ncbi:LysM peptidoglycan-binding domain-containing protein [Gallintestinimicrobium propionicum]|uniref:LysM peptidoglycan-binding domain-containing protein n=1 Tax=Gallintestinimicrobium propionicum TaxID=2981770 RepID=UPI0008223033|nr:LysM domain-containing protein [Gallintestinimicrobium propionicum]MCU6690970.1 LysM peptidoglycan-binding domain-containing protein [Gallintestinimicrobium propionicum]SCJ14277.1 LysM domain/BON superfamily protein [uncultured Clostridium sp.]